MFRQIRAWFHQKTVGEAVNLLKHQVNQELSHKDFLSAEATLRKIVELDAQEEEALVALSKVLLQQQKIEEGDEVLQKAITLNSEHRALILKVAQGYEKSGNWEKMVATLRVAIQKAPDMIEWRFYLAQRFFENTQLEKAELELREILKRDPEHLEAHIGLTHCYIQAGRKPQALEQVQKIQQWDQKRANELLSLIYENVQNFN